MNNMLNNVCDGSNCIFFYWTWFFFVFLFFCIFHIQGAERLFVYSLITQPKRKRSDPRESEFYAILFVFTFAKSSVAAVIFVVYLHSAWTYARKRRLWIEQNCFSERSPRFFFDWAGVFICMWPIVNSTSLQCMH